MTVTPQGKIKLCTTPLTNDYAHSITWANKQAQTNYFNNLSGFTDSEYTYIKKDNVVRINKNIDSLINYNYLTYTNVGFTNKTYYCFITNMEYLNEDCTAITFETDVLQTYYFDINYKKSFIEREHVSDDTLGLHTYPENLYTGEYEVCSHVKDTTLDNQVVIMASTVSPGEYLPLAGGVYQGIPSGVNYYNLGEYDEGIKNLLQQMMNDGKTDAVQSLFLAPKLFVQENNVLVPSSKTPHTYDINVKKWRSMFNYNLKNNKCLTYPFFYILVTNGQNGSIVLKQERWIEDTSDNMTLKVNCCLTPGCSINCFPSLYNEDSKNYLETLNLGKFPQINWSGDPYINWLTENGVNRTANYLSGATNIIKGGATKDIKSALTGFGEISSQMYTDYLADRVPPTLEGNSNNGDIIASLKLNAFHIYHMGCKKEYILKIDNYFSMFGYKVNEFKVPQFNSRQNWNFIKCIDLNIEGEIPQPDIEIIKSAFNNGITWWHNTNNILNYSKSNNIVKGN